jgi:hypothetical protein
MIPLSGRYNLSGKGGHAIYFSLVRKSKKIQYSSQLANPQTATFAEGPQNFNKIEVCKFAELRFAKLICGPPTLVGWSVPLTR